MDRITSTALSNTVLADTQRTLAQLATYQEQLSSGKRVNRVSDDPVAARSAMRYRAESLQTGKYLDNIAKATSFMNASDSAFNDMSQIMDQVKQLAVQGANGTEDADSRNALATSADSLLTRLVDLANTTYDGRFVFAGTATLDQPFAKSADGSQVTYQGNLDSFDVQVGPSSSVTVNQNGFALFQGDTDVFGSVIKLRDALKANDPTAVNNLLTTIDQAATKINDLHGAMGGEEQRLTMTQNQLESTKVELDKLVSDAEDADMTDTISKLQLAQTALQAGLQAGASVLKPSLLDYL